MRRSMWSATPAGGRCGLRSICVRNGFELHQRDRWDAGVGAGRTAGAVTTDGGSAGTVWTTP